MREKLDERAGQEDNGNNCVRGDCVIVRVVKGGRGEVGVRQR